MLCSNYLKLLWAVRLNFVAQICILTLLQFPLAIYHKLVMQPEKLAVKMGER